MTDEQQIRDLIQRWAVAVHDGDLATVLADHAPNIVMLDRLRALNTVEVVDDQRWVDEGPVVTSAGVSAGIDMALHLVGRLCGAELARGVQKAVEYFPDPPYADVPLPVTVSAR